MNTQVDRAPVEPWTLGMYDDAPIELETLDVLERRWEREDHGDDWARGDVPGCADDEGVAS